MLGNTELSCQNRPVTLSLREQNHKIGVIQNVLDLPAGQKVFHILREGAGNAAFLSQHFPHRHKIAGGQRITEQDMELIEVAPCRHALPEVGIYRLGHKFICDVHGDLAEVFSHVFQHDTHHPAVGFHIRGMVKQVEGAGAVELKGSCHTPGLGLRLFQELLVQVLQKRGFSRIKPKGLFPVHQPHTAVNNCFFDGL